MKPAEWGVAVEKKGRIYLHITEPLKVASKLVFNNFPYRIKKVFDYESGKSIDYTFDKKSKTLTLQPGELDKDAVDNVIVLRIAR